MSHKTDVLKMILEKDAFIKKKKISTMHLFFQEHFLK